VRKMRFPILLLNPAKPFRRKQGTLGIVRHANLGKG